MNVHSSRMMLTVAGEQHAILSEPGRRLSEVLRDDLGLKSVKIGCDAGDCGACTVLIDGRQHCACLTPVAQVAGRRVETVETADPALMGRLQKAFEQQSRTSGSHRKPMQMGHSGAAP